MALKLECAQNQLEVPTTKSVIQQVFLTISQVMLVLPICRLHLETAHGSRENLPF